MASVLEILQGEVSSKGRTFPNRDTFTQWLDRLSNFKRYGQGTDAFYREFHILVYMGQVQITEKRGNVRVDLSDKG